MQRHAIGHDKLQQVRDSLRSSRLFKVLDDRQFDSVMHGVRACELAPGEKAFAQGEPSYEFFMVESGQIKLVLHSVDGADKVVELISAGNFFAEALMFGQQERYPVSAESVGLTALWCIDVKRYSGVLKSSTDACFAMLGQLSQRLHWCMAEIDQLSLHSTLQRLVIHLMNAAVPDAQGGAVILLTTPKRVLASRLSMTPETLSRLLASLEKSGLIHANGAEIAVPDIRLLERLLRADHTTGIPW